MAKITRKIRYDSFIYTNYYHSYDTLDLRDFHHYRIDHSDKFADEENHFISIVFSGIKQNASCGNTTELKFFPLFQKKT